MRRLLSFLKKQKNLIKNIRYILLMGNPLALLFLISVIIIPVVSGFFLHKFLYDRWKKNWLAFLISLLGIFPLLGILAMLGKILFLRTIPGPTSLGEGLGAGIGMALVYSLLIFMGLVLYLLTLIIISIYYKVKKKYSLFF